MDKLTLLCWAATLRLLIFIAQIVLKTLSSLIAGIAGDTITEQRQLVSIEKLANQALRGLDKVR